MPNRQLLKISRISISIYTRVRSTITLAPRRTCWHQRRAAACYKGWLASQCHARRTRWSHVSRSDRGTWDWWLGHWRLKNSKYDKKGSKILGFFKGGTRIAVQTAIGTDKLKAKAGSVPARIDLGLCQGLVKIWYPALSSLNHGIMDKRDMFISPLMQPLPAWPFRLIQQLKR